MAKATVDKTVLVAKLAIDEEKLCSAEELALDQMSLPVSILKLADIDEDSLYQLCRSVAERLLDQVPEPEEIDLPSAEEEDEWTETRSKNRE
jgi:hypothetical protein